MQIFQDMATAVKLLGEVRKARKEGANGIRIQPVWVVPAARPGYWTWTLEAGLFTGEKWRPLQDVFSRFPEETQRALTFSPQPGKWAERARFWAQALQPALEPGLYHEAMGILLRWYARCVKRANLPDSATSGERVS